MSDLLNAISVRANADTAHAAAQAMSAGAEGVGLCRTEQMFFATDRLSWVRAVVLTGAANERIAALEELLPMQQHHFEEIFRAVSPLPVSIRLLDPLLHEFLPTIAELDAEMVCARADENWELCVALADVSRHAKALAEANPMMGHRGCRLSMTYPEILDMQVRAILRAALVVAAAGQHPRPEIMVPLVACEQEMKVLAEMIRAAADEVFARANQSIEFKIGTMIELPRAAVCAGPIARHVDFVSFGTDDLTSMTYGCSRDDSHRYLESYLARGILKADPFVTIDREGVGALMEMAIRSVRSVNPVITIGVCGEHGGDPESIRFFQSLGVDYVSCSPARIRTAQEALGQRGGLNQEMRPERRQRDQELEAVLSIAS